VGRAVQKNQAAGLPAEYARLTMPNETRNYVPKLQALKNIVAQPELFNFTLPYVANRPYFVTVDMPATLDLATAARLADTPLEEFMALNPSYRKPVIPKGSQALVIPADKEAVFRANLSDFNPGAPRWKAYEVGPGERIDAIAARLGVTPQQLRELNGLSAGSRLTEGQTLLVPAGADPGAKVSAAMAAARLIPDEGVAPAPVTPRSRADKKPAAGKGSAAARPAAAKSPAKAAASPARKPASAEKPVKKKP
jgi:peptidoglycan lytic transglycosylase D